MEFTLSSVQKKDALCYFTIKRIPNTKKQMPMTVYIVVKQAAEEGWHYDVEKYDYDCI